MDQNSPFMLHDAQQLINFEHWARRFAFLAILVAILTLLSLMFALISLFSNPPTYGGTNVPDDFLSKSSIVSPYIFNVFNFAVAYLLSQGLSKIIRYLLNLKSLALKRYHARKTSA